MVRAAFVSPLQNHIELLRGDDHRTTEPMASVERICPLSQRALGNGDATRRENIDPFGRRAASVEDVGAGGYGAMRVHGIIQSAARTIPGLVSTKPSLLDSLM
jgi:hypothetical protein